MPGTIDDLRAVGRPPGAAIVTRRRRKLSQIAAIDIHRVDVEVPVLQRGEDELLPIRRDDAFRGVDAVAREPVQLTAVGASSVDAVSYTHLRAHETGRNLVCRLLLEK